MCSLGEQSAQHGAERGVTGSLQQPSLSFSGLAALGTSKADDDCGRFAWNLSRLALVVDGHDVIGLQGKPLVRPPV